MNSLILMAMLVGQPGVQPGPIAGPTIEIPAERTVKPGRALTLEAKTNGKSVQWIAATDDFDLVPLSADGMRVLFVCPQVGKYTLYAYTALGDVPSSPAKCVITVQGDGPPVPVPPKPIPPVPPVPVPPVPNDPLTAELAAIYTADSGVAKASHLGLMVELYRQSQELAVDPSVLTVLALSERVRAASGILIPATAMKGLRAKIAGVIGDSLPSDPDAKLDDATRKKAAEVFRRIETSLKGIAK